MDWHYVSHQSTLPVVRFESLKVELHDLYQSSEIYGSCYGIGYMEDHCTSLFSSPFNFSMVQIPFPDVLGWSRKRWFRCGAYNLRCYLWPSDSAHVYLKWACLEKLIVKSCCFLKGYIYSRFDRLLSLNSGAICSALS